ncbi:MAG: RluA family pseudouridine synthase [bacterium]|nr:RluA family pseudouridine synthase [bacterium]
MTAGYHLSIPILYEEPHFLLINKPAGIFSQAAAHIPSVASILESQIRARDAHPGKPFVGLPHRLDRGTSGVMLIARNARALKRFGQQFQSRKIGKFYLAIVEGQLESGPQDWQDTVRKVENEPRAEAVHDPSQGRLATAEALQVATAPPFSLLLIRLHTGRMHQIRLQASLRRLPIVGDQLYGACRPFAEHETSPDAANPALALHALRLEFRHPQTARPMSGTAALPPIWQAFHGELAAHAAQLVQLSQAQAAVQWQLKNLGGLS